MTFQRLVIDLQGGDTLEKATFILKRMIDRRAGLVVIFGGIGSGKTHLAAATAHEWRERYSSTPIMVNTTALADYLKASFESNSRRSLDDRIRLITQSPLLVLDNYRITNKTSEWVLDKLAYLIDFRYNRNLPTIITLINEFATQLSELQPLTYSRLMDQNRVDWCGLATDDFRQVYSRRSMY